MKKMMVEKCVDGDSKCSFAEYVSTGLFSGWKCCYGTINLRIPDTGDLLPDCPLPDDHEAELEAELKRMLDDLIKRHHVIATLLAENGGLEARVKELETGQLDNRLALMSKFLKDHKGITLQEGVELITSLEADLAASRAKVDKLQGWKEGAIAKMRVISPCPAKERCPGPDAACSCYECLDDAFDAPEEGKKEGEE